MSHILGQQDGVALDLVSGLLFNSIFLPLESDTPFAQCNETDIAEKSPFGSAPVQSVRAELAALTA